MNTRTDAQAKCCTGTYYRYSKETWQKARPWAVGLQDEFVRCSQCGEALHYVDTTFPEVTA
jgi:hypothetical protein